jgi:hypothetical protein
VKLLLLLTICIQLSCQKGSLAEALDDEPATTVALFNHEHLHADRQTANAEVTLPFDKIYKSVKIELELACPHDLCDWWDRPGHIEVRKIGESDPSRIEVLRFMTPYRVGGKWVADITYLQPLLRGRLEFQTDIETSAAVGGPQGDGWLVTARLILAEGESDNYAKAVVPLWGLEKVTYGHPQKPPLRTTTVSIPNIPFSQARIISLVTGHGQGNIDNCGEFCKKDHFIVVGMQKYSTLLWRDNCEQNPVSSQMGNWEEDRAGWCPGDIVQPWVFKLDQPLSPGDSLNIQYYPQAYLNTCRPDADVCECLPPSPIGPQCAFNGDSHNEPHYLLSSFLILE